MKKHSYALSGARMRRLAGVAVVATLIGASLAACSSSSSDGGSKPSASYGASDLNKALHTKTTLTVWGWDPGLKPQAEGFEKAYPDITVNVVNVGTGGDEYTKLQNSVKAGSGAPDVAQMEYYALPQFALSGALYDLRNVGFQSLKSLYSVGAWQDVVVQNGIYGLPLGTGPMALFYNKTVWDKFGITTPPATWDEYVADAKKIHDADPKSYITNDTGDAGFTTSLIWQAGGRPFTTTGTSNVSINMNDAGTRKFADTWSPMVQQGLVDPVASWSDQWYAGLSDGTISSLVIGAWMGGNLESGVPTGKGQWRVAPMPQFTAGATDTAENGGGGEVVLKQSKHQLAAAAFLKWITTGEGQTIELNTVGGVPSTVANLDDAKWADTSWDYFGGQKINQIFVQSANNVAKGWQYLPYQVYANSIFGDTVGKSYQDKSSLALGLAAWQKSLVSYGNDQGFKVKAG